MQIPAQRPQNRKIVISDLHLGIGQARNGSWSALEDFRFPAIFRSFLDSMGKPGNTDLIIAGDFIDFWQVLPELDEKRPAQLGPSEAESLAKLNLVLIRHQQTFADLKRFAETGKNRLIIIPGNHDVDLFWPKVQSVLQRTLGLPINQKLFFTGNCYESQGVHIEHGHQYDQANRFKSANAPFVVDDNSVRRLESNWGTVFMSRFYNNVELQKPFIDNLTPELAGIAWALQNEFAFSMKQLGQLVVMMVRDQKVLDQFKISVDTLGDDDDPPQNVPEKTVDNLLALYERADPELAKMLRATVRSKEARREAEKALEEISDEEWTTLAAGFGKEVRTETLENKLREYDAYIRAARNIVRKQPEISIVVMAHTHELDAAAVKLENVGHANRWYVNTGCWQKVLRVKTARESRKWSNLNLDDSIFPLRFSYVIIDYDGDKIMAPVRSFWMQ